MHDIGRTGQAHAGFSLVFSCLVWTFFLLLYLLLPLEEGALTRSEGIVTKELAETVLLCPVEVPCAAAVRAVLKVDGGAGSSKAPPTFQNCPNC